MKILYCLAGTFNSGGMERIVINKANWLAKRNNEVIIVTTEQQNRKDFYPLKNVERIDLEINYSNSLNYTIIKKFFFRKKKIDLHKKLLKEIIKNKKPDIIISTFGNEVSFLPKINKKGINILEIHFSRWYRLQANRKGIWKLIDYYLTHLDYKYVKKYNKFICLTNEDKLNWNNLPNMEVINNFIETLNYEPVLKKNNSVIAVGRLEYQKGFDRLISAWVKVHQLHPDWVLNIYGDGPLKEVLLEEIKKYKLQNSIKINKATQDIKDKYKENSFLIMSSHYEGLPMVMLEALSSGLPVVSFDFQCGPKDVIQNSYNGLLVKNNDIEALSYAIIKIIENEELRKSMSYNAYLSSKRFSKDIIMNKWVKVFQQEIKKNKTS